MEIDPVWKNISLALGAEPREYATVRGASGIDHNFTALAVDDPGKRLILFSPDPDPRVAALTQVDVQVTMPGTRVLIARPLAVDLGVLARNVSAAVGSTRIDVPRAMTFMNALQNRTEKVRSRAMDRVVGRVRRQGLDAMMGVFKEVSLPTVGQLVSVLQQSASLDWPHILSMIGRDEADRFVSLEGLLKLDTLVNDRRHGVCPIPFYELSTEDWEVLRSDVTETRAQLQRLGVYEYFFPAPDELALGFVDNGVGSREGIERATRLTEEFGHHPGTPTIVDASNPFEVIEALEERGFLVEGEFGLETTPEGQAYRSTVRYRPKEGVFSKILSRFSFNASVTPKDFL